jgi:hypothetical protein
MITNVKRILADLDKHASEFNFPILNNAYVEFAAARLTAYCDKKDWLIVFEVLGFSTREIEFVDDVYAFGSCVERDGLAGEEIPLTPLPEQPLFDAETNECIADWSHWSVKLDKDVLSFSPTLEEYSQAGIVLDRSPGPGSLSEIELLRFLVYRVGEERLFMSDQVLMDHFPRCKKLPKFVQTTKWQHPDVADGETPSENVSMRTLLEALSTGDPSFFTQGRPNTHWKYWDGAQKATPQDEGPLSD